MISAPAGMGFETAPADGAFYAFVKVAGDDVAVARDWLNSAHVAVTPGTAFCAPAPFITLQGQPGALPSLSSHTFFPSLSVHR